MIQYYVLHQDEAAKYLASRAVGDEVELDTLVRTAGSGAFIADNPIRQLRSDLAALQRQYPAQLRKRDQEGGQFEAEACALVHQRLSEVDAEARADPDFWTWLAIKHFADLIEWRFGVTEGIADRKNYGVGSRTENLLFRLWLRADIGCTEGHDPYELARFGDQDLWRSHLIRQGYTSARCVARALLRLQAGTLRVGKTQGHKLASSGKGGIRDLAKELRRLRSNVMFEFLTQNEADAVVLELSTKLKKAS